jgi:hypothetical protein
MLPRTRRRPAKQPPSVGTQHNKRRNIIGPFAGGARSVIGALQPDIKASSGRILDITDDPIAAGAMSVGQVMTAQGFGVAREAACQIASGADHGSSRD